MLSRFSKDTIFTITSRVLMVIIGMGSSIIITRVLGPEGKGIYSLAILLPSLLICFGNFGINPSTVLNIGKRKYPVKEIFYNNIKFAIIITIFLSLIGTVIILLLGKMFFAGVKQQYLFLALGLIPFDLFFNFASHVLIGLQLFKKYNIISILRSFIFFSLIVIFLLLFKLRIKTVIYAQIFSFLLVGVPLFFLVKRAIGLEIGEKEKIPSKLSMKYFKDIFYYGSKVHLASIISFFHYRLDIFLINYFLNPTEVGLYSVAVAIAEMMLLISQSASTVLFPKVASETDKKRLKEFTPLVCRNILFLGLLLSIFLFINIDWLVVLVYSKAFSYSAKVFKILLIGELSSLGWGILNNDLNAREKPMVNTYIVGASVLINLGLNILLIPKWGILGAAWATAISYFFMFITTVYIYSIISGNKKKNIIILQKTDLNIYKGMLLNFRRLVKP